MSGTSHTEQLAESHAAIRELLELLDKERALCDKMAKVLGRYWFTTVDEGEYAEDYNNDDVIEVCKEYEAHRATDPR